MQNSSPYLYLSSLCITLKALPLAQDAKNNLVCKLLVVF